MKKKAGSSDAASKLEILERLTKEIVEIMTLPNCKDDASNAEI